MFRIKLKELREDKGQSQQEFADKFGVAQSTVGGWESGAREPSIQVLIRIADYFSISLDELLRQETLASHSEQEEIDSYIPVAEKISEMRKSQGLNNERFAELCGISVLRLNRIESGKAMPTVEELVRFARVLCCSADFLLGLEWMLEGSFGPGLNHIEKTLLQRFRRLSSRGQDKLQEYADDLIRAENNYDDKEYARQPKIG